MDNSQENYLGIEYPNLNYLSHHGVLGMKWGVRRYQKSDGTLTDAGRKKMLKRARKYEGKVATSVGKNYISRRRRAKLTQKAKDARYEVKVSDLKKVRINKEKKKDSHAMATSRSKSISDMTDDELRTAVNRLTLEQQYKNLKPNTKSKGQKFISYVGKNIVLPEVTSASRGLLREIINDSSKELKKRKTNSKGSND